MNKERKTIDIVGVIKFRYHKKPSDLASVVEGCVGEWSMGGRYSTESVALRNVAVVKVVCRKGVASVVFKARVYRDGRDAVSLGNDAVTAVWEACHSRYAEPDDEGLVLLDLEDVELRTPAKPQHCRGGFCLSTFGYGHCECPCEDCIAAAIYHG